MGQHLTNPAYDWSYKSTPQKYVNDRQLLCSRGKGLGGSTLVNYMGWVRPTKGEMDDIAKMAGAEGEGWDWDGLVKYMDKVGVGARHLLFCF
jgi:choline dehydrogenase-like flavoprotein